MLKSEGYSDEAEREKSVDAIGKFPAMVPDHPRVGIVLDRRDEAGEGHILRELTAPVAVHDQFAR